MTMIKVDVCSSRRSGNINSDRIKALAYFPADLFVLPTKADNLPLVLQESMACGTSIV